MDGGMEEWRDGGWEYLYGEAGIWRGGYEGRWILFLAWGGAVLYE